MKYPYLDRPSGRLTGQIVKIIGEPKNTEDGELKPGVGSKTVSSCSGPLNQSPAISGFLHPRLGREAWKHSQTSATAAEGRTFPGATLSRLHLSPPGPRGPREVGDQGSRGGGAGTGTCSPRRPGLCAPGGRAGGRVTAPVAATEAPLRFRQR